MNRDSVDSLLRQWAEARPGIDPAPLGVVVRIELLGQAIDTRIAEAEAAMQELPADEQQRLASVLRRLLNANAGNQPR